jgi:hypothetical protein
MVAPNVNAPDARAQLAQAQADRVAADVRIDNALLPAQRQNIAEADRLNRVMINRIPMVIHNNPDIEPALRRIFIEFRRDLNDQATVLRDALQQNQEVDQRRVGAARGAHGAVAAAPAAPAAPAGPARPAGPAGPAGDSSLLRVTFFNDDVHERPTQRRRCQRDNNDGCGGCGR